MTESTALALRREFAPIVIPAQQELLNAVSNDLEDIRELDVDSDAMVAAITEAIGRVSSVAAELDATRLRTSKPLREGQDWVNQGYNPAINAMNAAITNGKAKLTAWARTVRLENERIQRELEAKRKAEAAAADALAKQQREEAERMAAAAVAETDLNKQAELIVAAQEQADVAQTQAAAAQQIANAPVVLTPVRFADPVKGTRKTWKARVANKAALVAGIAKLMETDALAAAELLDLLDVSEAKLNAIAKVQKNNLRVPGCVAYEDEGISVRKVAV